MTTPARPPASAARLRILVPEELRHFLPARRRGSARDPDGMPCPYDGAASLGHVVQSLGVPLTEVSRLRADGEPVPAAYRPPDGARIELFPVPRPQSLPPTAPMPPRFVLDVHLGALARRLRLLGVDTAYRNDAADPELVEQAAAERRILLTQDRGLLLRRALWLGAYVRGSRPDEQLTDVLDRFAPPLDPWTRCPACNGTLASVPKEEVAEQLPSGTRRTYDTFTRCTACGHLYWPGAHHPRLAARVAAARRASGGGPASGDGSGGGPASGDGSGNSSGRDAR
ncbi:Mut7-C RNAse domain-containing protein [Streptomyces sp. NPDC006925]|uniref:Mut7-C RNAse domain-containing protein n=2 Tax=unclassified Streptomyces TaxID=2593676 RepID=UPI0036A73DF5